MNNCLGVGELDVMYYLTVILDHEMNLKDDVTAGQVIQECIIQSDLSKPMCKSLPLNKMRTKQGEAVPIT
jgi:hypothetical protein